MGTHLATDSIPSILSSSGAHAAEALDLPIIGVAKTPSTQLTHAVEVVRDASTRRLYVTVASGTGTDEAARIVAAMAGRNPNPSVLARVDRLAATESSRSSSGKSR